MKIQETLELFVSSYDKKFDTFSFVDVKVSEPNPPHPPQFACGQKYFTFPIIISLTEAIKKI